MKTWAVYIHISPSNKYYVGITSMKPIKKRWANGKGYSKNKYFSRAIEKYGWSNFKHIIYAENLTQEEAKKIEISLITQYNSTQNQFGYNITSGGEGAAGLIKTQYQIDMIKLASSKPIYQFDLDYNFIKEFPSIREAARQYNVSSKSGIRECCILELKSSYGYIWRYKEDVKNPYDKSTIRKYIDKYNVKEVYGIDVLTRSYILYQSIKEICNLMNLDYHKIYDCCSGRRKTYNGFLWKYAQDINNIETFINNDANFQIGFSKQIAQYDMNNNFIKQFISALKAGKQLGIDRKRIIACCDNKIDSYKGFIWKYK